MFNLMKKIISKILLKITILVIVEIILIVGSFSVLAYFQSQQSSIGNSINIAGKNRYLTANLLFQTEKYIDGSSDASQLKAAMDSLQSNIMTLKQGGRISGIDLRPLPSGLLDLWKAIDQKWNDYKTSVAKEILIPNRAKQATSSPLTAIDRSLAEKGLESKAFNLVNSSDKLVTQLGQQTDKNSENVMFLHILFAILIVGILVLILYLVARMLKPIFVLTQATSEIKKGNLDVSVEQKGSDELSVLSESFNSMVGSIRSSTIKQDELTKKLEVANEELKYKDRLKDEFINIAAHELKTPIQPILGLTEILHSQVKDVKQRELLEVTIRNAKRLQRLTNDILDVTKIESKSLGLNKEQFNLNDVVINAMNDLVLGKEFHDSNSQNIKLSYDPQDILLRADKGRIAQVISNLLSNAFKSIKENGKGGTVTIDIENKVSAGGPNKNDREIVVSISDEGESIDSKILPSLFSKFVSKYSSKGTGLGLFISKSIVEAHGGKIWAENNSSSDGKKGAVFTFSIPLSKG
ncbi:MAG: ATP-binding protein, partial [Thermoproteota archaeon]|nr:ATP-binding protein [Thermoproteota archaeon]